MSRVIEPLTSPAVNSQPKIWLRLEAAAAVSAAIALYAHGGYSWILFAVLFLIPDITFVAYVAGPMVGGICYNIAHSYVSPIILAALLYLLEKSLAIPLIWIAHIGMDRVLGYGLKYSAGFGFTHLGRLGKKQSIG